MIAVFFGATWHTYFIYFIAWHLNKLAIRDEQQCEYFHRVVGWFPFHLPQFSESTLIVFLLSNTSCSFNWCLSILFSLSSAPDNVAVTVFCLISILLHDDWQFDGSCNWLPGLLSHQVNNRDGDGRLGPFMCIHYESTHFCY